MSILREYGIDCEDVRIITALRGAETLSLRIPSVFRHNDDRLAPAAVDHLVVVPSQRNPLRMPRADLHEDPHHVAGEIGRRLELLYRR